jgi:prophage DNA circulation protein
MAKRLLSEGMLDKFFNLFLKAKSQNKEVSWLNKLKKEDPELADVWSNWNDSMNDVLKKTQTLMKSKGVNTDDIDSFIKNNP